MISFYVINRRLSIFDNKECLSIGYQMTCFSYHARWPKIWQKRFIVVSQRQAPWRLLCIFCLIFHLSRCAPYLRSVYSPQLFDRNARKYSRMLVDAISIATKVDAELTMMTMKWTMMNWKMMGSITVINVMKKMTTMTVIVRCLLCWWRTFGKTFVILVSHTDTYSRIR